MGELFSIIFEPLVEESSCGRMYGDTHSPAPFGALLVVEKLSCGWIYGDC